MENLKLLALTLLFLSLFSCERDPNQTKLQYMPDMADAPTVKTQENYLDPPEGSVAVNAMIYPKTPEEAERTLVNPFLGAHDENKHLLKGKKLWETYFVVCHGPNAKGKGHITDKFPAAADLTMDMFKNRKDGFFFHRITFGSSIMPGYGHATSPHERWEIVLYLRSLQNGGMR